MDSKKVDGLAVGLAAFAGYAVGRVMMAAAQGPRIACCMIVKNGARTLGALLGDLKGAFDEIVIVDTGSTDNTRELVIGALLDFDGLPDSKSTPEKVSAWWAGAQDKEHAVFETMNGRVILAKFDWIKDFAAARNFSFSLATAEWRGYFDADDRVPDVKYLRKTLQAAQARNPQANCVVLPYDYVPGEVRQEVSRFFRVSPDVPWASEGGWGWVDEIHEHVEGQQKRTLHFDALLVTQDKIEEEHFASRVRNREILLAHYEKAEKGAAKRGRLAFHLGQDATFERQSELAIELFVEAADCLEHSSLGASALVQAARVADGQEDMSSALSFAGRAMAEYPMVSETTLLVALLNAKRGAFDVAASFFDVGFKTPDISRRTVIDLVFNEGLVPTYAALSYLRVGRLDDALVQLKRVPVKMYYMPEVRPAFYSVQEEVMREYGLRLMKQMVEFYQWNTESLTALQFLDRMVPKSLSDRPEIAELVDKVESKIPHILDGWEAYQRYYSEVPRETFFEAGAQHEDARASIRQTGRAKKLMAWIDAQPKEGAPIEVLAIGANDASIEEGLLISNPRVQLTLSDAAAQTSEIFQQLKVKYGEDRIFAHSVETDACDWLPREPGKAPKQFDAIVIFEVFEHVPDDDDAVVVLRSGLKPTGRLFLSTPNARRWVEPYLTGDKDVYPIYWHVRAHNPTSIAELFHNEGFDVNVELLDHGGCLFLDATLRDDSKGLPHVNSLWNGVAIFAGGARPNFDALTVRESFLGGSETAVVYLAEALARRGIPVTVFTESVRRPEFNFRQIVRYAGVNWRDINDFDPAMKFDSVLYWRCPSVLDLPRFANARHRKVLWLHDCAHLSGNKGYANADVVLALSVAHSRALMEFDGYDGACQLVSNGLDPAAFPELGDVPRDAHKAVYASSPERGLERLLEWWPLIRARVPDATLEIFYDWKNAREKLPELVASLEAQLALLKEHGVTYRGGVPQPELHRVLRGAGVWAYPTSGAAETFCILATSAMASGCWPVTSAAGALPETLGDYAAGCVVSGLSDESIDTEVGRDIFVDAVVSTMEKGELPVERGAMRDYALKTYNWDEVAKKFIKALQAR